MKTIDGFDSEDRYSCCTRSISSVSHRNRFYVVYVSVACNDWRISIGQLDAAVDGNTYLQALGYLGFHELRRGRYGSSSHVSECFRHLSTCNQWWEDGVQVMVSSFPSHAMPSKNKRCTDMKLLIWHWSRPCAQKSSPVLWWCFTHMHFTCETLVRRKSRTGQDRARQVLAFVVSDQIRSDLCIHVPPRAGGSLCWLRA